MRPLAGPDLSGQVRIPAGCKNLLAIRLTQQKTLGKPLVICEVNSHLREINRLPIHHTVSGTGASGYPRRTELSHGNLPSTDAQAESEMGPACPRVRPHERTHGAYAGFRTGARGCSRA